MISGGSTLLELNFTCEMHIGKFYPDGMLQPAGTYSAATASKFIKGKGILKIQ